MSHLAIKTVGQGKPLIFFHGWGFDSHIWQSLLPDLRDYQLFLVDLPGFGQSANMSWAMFKETLLAQVPKQFGVIGWSLGGLFATRLALEAPLRVTKLLQITSSPYFVKTENWPGIEPESLDGFYQQFKLDPHATRHHFIQAQLPKDMIWPQANSTICNVSGLDEGLAILKQWDFRTHLGQLTMPVAYLFGRLDRIVSHRILEHLQTEFPGFHYHLLPKSGHMPFLSHRTAFLEWFQEVV
jgi:pimeloyl-[acyl-carrier protein] methyl ester esterase